MAKKTTKKSKSTMPKLPKPPEGYVSRMGRPPKFETVEQMEDQIDRYFADCEARGQPLTITGLALALNLSRQGLIEYGEKNDEKANFSDTVKRAKLIVENYAEILVLSRGHAGAIFALKNFGWKDKTEVYQEHTYTQMGKITATLADGTKKSLSFNVGKKREKKQ